MLSPGLTLTLKCSRLIYAFGFYMTGVGNTLVNVSTRVIIVVSLQVPLLTLAKERTVCIDAKGACQIAYLVQYRALVHVIAGKSITVITIITEAL